ncbi:MAG: hypothetical protein KGL39_48980 [Patescibacteria group bacterium]|nr:hypothetical protein [Patescibacteria group bacterium]
MSKYRVSEERHLQPDRQPTPGKKDTKNWCKGKVGREHVVEIVLPTNMNAWSKKCGPSRWLPYPWSYCHHVEACKACGKHLRHLTWAECPENGGS